MKSIAALFALAAPVLAGLENAQPVKHLNAKTWDAAIQEPQVGTLVAFYAPWCGHCKSLEPVYSKVGKAFKTDSKCQIAALDADAAENKDLASKYGVRGFPTIKLIKSGGAGVVDYSDSRTEQAFLDFLNAECGTQRVSGGGLSELAGRIAALDALASKYLASSKATRDDLIKQAQGIAGNLKEKSAQIYLKTFQKLAENEAYLTKEAARLRKILEKQGTLAFSKIEELQIKQNVLEAFNGAKGKVADAAEAASSAAAEASDRVKEEL